MDPGSTALIVAPPGLLREALQAALEALHPLQAVQEADSVAQARALDGDPALVLLSAEKPDASGVAAVRAIRARWPAARCIVLVDTKAQQRRAKAAGAEQALIKGVRPGDLLALVEAML
jgi:DNA-binding NarL/FixJ family response regulator